MNCQINNYSVDSTGKWCNLTGIYQEGIGGVGSYMQLFLIEKKHQQILDGFVGTFTEMPVTDANDYKNSLFCFCEKKANENTHRLIVSEIGEPAPKY